MVWKLVHRSRHIYVTEKLVIKTRNPAVPFNKANVPIRVQVDSSRKPISQILRLIWNDIFNNLAKEDNISSMNMKPPASVRGMKTLDRDAFNVTTQVPCFKLPAGQINNGLKKFKKHLLRLPGIKPVAELDQSDPEKGTHKLFLLDPECIPSAEALTTEDTEFLKNCGVNTESFKYVDE